MLAALLQIVHGAERIGAQCLKIVTILPDVAGGRTSAIFCDLVEPGGAGLGLRGMAGEAVVRHA